jgi:acyl-CoA reductase-like NAD-dependent aldehyde dehydrogenase
MNGLEGTSMGDPGRFTRFRHELSQQVHKIAGEVAALRSVHETEVILTEVMPLLSACRFLERHGASILKARRAGPGRLPWWLFGVGSMIHRVPHGQVMILSPSNYPLMLSGIQTLQALFAGNRVILKPSPGAGKLWALIRDILYSTGFSQSDFTLETEDPEALRRSLDSGIDKLVMTGGVQNGRKVYEAVAGHGIPATLELSGWDSCIVGPDAEPQIVQQALKFAVSLNHARTCIAPHRLFVPSSQIHHYEKLLADVPWESLFTEGGTPAKASESLKSAVNDALNDGAAMVHGSWNQSDSTAWPVILSGCQPSMRICREDFFAPVLALIPYESDSELIALANDCPFALGSSIFTPDRQWAGRIASRIRAGIVTINDIIACTADPRIPFGGSGASGFGVTRGTEGLLEMTRVKVIQSRRHKKHPHFDRIPDGAGPILGKLLLMTNASDMRTFLKALGGMTALLRKSISTRKKTSRDDRST